MLKLGVFTQWIKASSIEELANRVRDLDLQCVVLDSFPGMQMDLNEPSADECLRIKNAFASAGVEIAAVGGYYNLAHPDPEERQIVHRRFMGLMQLCKGIGAPMLCSEAGTFHPKSEWDWDPANLTEQAFLSLVDAMRPLVARARELNIVIGIEPYVMTIIHTPERAARLVEGLGAEHLQIVADPAGMMNRVTLKEQETFLPAAFQAISPYIGLVHVEDCRPDPKGHFLWLGAGKGLINYPIFMDLVVQSGYRGPLILEHLSEDDLPSAREYAKTHWEQALAREQKGVHSA